MADSPKPKPPRPRSQKKRTTYDQLIDDLFELEAQYPYGTVDFEPDEPPAKPPRKA